MCKAKRVLAWLLVFAMVLSLIPQNVVRAEKNEEYTEEYADESYSDGADSDVNDSEEEDADKDDSEEVDSVEKYSGEEDIDEEDSEDEEYHFVTVGSYVSSKDGTYGAYIGADFPITVPDQEGVIDYGEGSYGVKDQIILHITLPIGYGTDHLTIWDWNADDQISGIEYVECGEGTYSVTIPVVQSMNLDVQDDTYCNVSLSSWTDSFNCYFVNGDGDWQGYVKRGESCTLYFEKNEWIENAEISKLEITVNDIDVNTEELTEVESGSKWSYQIESVDGNQTISIYEAGKAVTISMSVPEGYEFQDENGETIDIQDEFYPRSVVFSTIKNGTITFRVKGESDVLDYAIFYNDEEIKGVKVEDCVYSYTISNVILSSNLAFEKKCKLISQVNIVLCDEDGVVLDGQDQDGYQELYVYNGRPNYFKPVNTTKKYDFSTDCGVSVSPEDNGSYYCLLFYDFERETMQLIAEEKYVVQYYDDTGHANILPNGYAESGDLDGDGVIDCFYISGICRFDVCIDNWDDTLDYENMNVTVTGEDGEEVATNMIEQDECDGQVTFTYETEEALTQNVTIHVTGIYGKWEKELYLKYDSKRFAGLTFTLEDVDTEEKQDYMDCFNVYESKSYNLIISGNAEVLSELRATAVISRNDKTEQLDFVKQGDGSIKAAVKGTYDEITIYGANDFYVDYLCESGLNCGSIAVCGSGTDVRGYYQAGPLQFFITADWGYTAANAEVTKIVDSKGDTVAFTFEEDQEIDDYGNKGTVYTVDVKDSITIYYTGIEAQKTDIYLPSPSATDGYTISSLKVCYYDEDSGDEVEEEITGIADSQNKRTRYSVEFDTNVIFEITVPDSRDLLVKRTYLRYEDSRTYTLSPRYVETNEDGSVTYQFYMWVEDESMAITATTNTRKLNITMKDGKGFYEQIEDEQGDLYNAILNEEGEVLAYVYNLPTIMDNEDTGTVYSVYIDIPRQRDEVNGWQYKYRLTRGKGNQLFTAYDAKDNTYSSLCVDEGIYDAEFELPAGMTKLEIDIDCFVEKMNYIKLTSDREDIEIAPVERGEATYQAGAEEGEYIPDTDELYFTLTATDKADFDDMCIDWGSRLTEYDEDYEESEDGLTRTYKLVNIQYDTVIRVTYESQYELQSGEEVELESWEYEPDDDGVVRGVPSGITIPVLISTTKGYDPDSVTVIQKCYNDEGEEIEVERYSPEEYIGEIAGGYNDWIRQCSVTLRPGKNIIYVTEPTQITYKVTLPTDKAYTIEPEGESTTTVGYGGDFSFRIKGNTGYDISKIQVTANNKTVTPNEKGVYKIRNIKEDITIRVTGYEAKTPDKVTYVVTFKDYDGSVIGSPQTVEVGKAAKAPADPQRKGYRFKGWDKSFSNIQSNLVVNALYEPILVSKITVTGDIVKLAVGKTVQLKADAAPTDALNKGVVWTSSNEKFATVDANGKVKALKNGAGKTVTITATATDGSGIKGSFTIKIYKNAVKKIKLSAKTKSVKPGKKVTIKAKVSPTKNVNKTLKWSSSNEKYATVNSKGVVTTKKAGKGKTVIITAKATDGSGKKATIKIKINKK